MYLNIIVTKENELKFSYILLTAILKYILVDLHMKCQRLPSCYLSLVFLKFIVASKQKKTRKELQYR